MNRHTVYELCFLLFIMAVIGIFAWTIRDNRETTSAAKAILLNAGGYSNIEPRPVSLKDNQDCGHQFTKYGAFTAYHDGKPVDVVVCFAGKNGTDKKLIEVDRGN